MSQHARTSTPKHAAPKKPARKPAGKQRRTPAAPATSTPLFSSRDLLPLLYLSGAFLFLELLLRIANTSIPFFDPALLRIIASSLAAGSLPGLFRPSFRIKPSRAVLSLRATLILVLSSLPNPACRSSLASTIKSPTCLVWADRLPVTSWKKRWEPSLRIFGSSRLRWLPEY